MMARWMVLFSFLVAYMVVVKGQSLLVSLMRLQPDGVVGVSRLISGICSVALEVS